MIFEKTETFVIFHSVVEKFEAVLYLKTYFLRSIN